MKVAESAVARKLETIQGVFQKSLAIASETDDLVALETELAKFDMELTSIAYEGASMGIAINELEAGHGLKKWLEFLPGAATRHSIQYHIGLGWALAQLQLETPEYTNLLDPIERYRVIDGYGYYEAMFRTRKSIHSRQMPVGLNAAGMSAYYQGIGRGIWYLNMGNVEGVYQMIEKLGQGLYADLWRGIGIASCYAGGCNVSVLNEMAAIAKKYKKQLAAGAVMAALCRQKAGFITEDTELTCKTWCKQSAVELVVNHRLNNTVIKANAETGYTDWIAGIESWF